jgi:hypothetical protein
MRAAKAMCERNPDGSMNESDLKDAIAKLLENARAKAASEISE